MALVFFAHQADMGRLLAVAKAELKKPTLGQGVEIGPAVYGLLVAFYRPPYTPDDAETCGPNKKDTPWRTPKTRKL